MNQRSPVPEWFGRGEPEHPHAPRPAGSAPSTPSRGRFGCVALLLAIGLGVGGIGFGLMQQQRAQRAETKLAQKRVELERTERLLAAERARAQPAPGPTPLAEPEPELPPAVDADASTAAEADAGNDLTAITALRPKLRACFDNALAYAPNSHGRMEVTLLVSDSGIVDDVTVVASGDLPVPVTSCVKAVARTARFGSATHPRSVRFPLVFQN